MAKIDDNEWVCDFGSGSRLRIGLNSSHVVLAIDEGGDMKKRSNIAVTPATLHALATRLFLIAEVYDPALRDERSMFLPEEWCSCRSTSSA